jgi:hypothetical protein
MNEKIDYLKFLDLHAGPEYAFYYKSAYTNMVIIIAMIFGPAFPLLYFISLFSLCNQYIMERISLTYFYRIPPKFNESLTERIIHNVAWCPLIAMAVTFWLYTNKQMFGNTVDPIETQNEITLSHHLVGDVKWKNLNEVQKQALIAMAAFGLVTVFYKLYWYNVLGEIKKLCNCGCFDTHEKIKYQSNKLPPYIEALKKKDIREFLENERQFKEYKVQCLDKELVDSL